MARAESIVPGDPRNPYARATHLALRLDAATPGDPRNPYARATILLRLGRTEEARQVAQRALQIQPAHSPARELLRSLP